LLNEAQPGEWMFNAGHVVNDEPLREADTVLKRYVRPLRRGPQPRNAPAEDTLMRRGG
jgi:hypothetical protein